MTWKDILLFVLMWYAAYYGNKLGIAAARRVFPKRYYKIEISERNSGGTELSGLKEMIQHFFDCYLEHQVVVDDLIRRSKKYEKSDQKESDQ